MDIDAILDAHPPKQTTKLCVKLNKNATRHSPADTVIRQIYPIFFRCSPSALMVINCALFIKIVPGTHSHTHTHENVIENV